jgi:hypothetical protein
VACPSCGKPTRVGAAFCGECGFKLSAVAAEPAVVEAPVVVPPLRRPPPPPPPAASEAPAPEPSALPEEPAVPAVSAPAVSAPPVIPEVAPVLLPSPPPVTAPKVVEVIPFGTTEEVTISEPAPAATITITAPPPGISAPPTATPVAEPVVSEQAPPSAPAVPPKPESTDETRVSVRRRTGVHWRLVLPDARQVEVTKALIVGRDPSANQKWAGAALLTLDDHAHSVSKTHAVFEVDADGLWVTDLDSTNGVVITQPDGTEIDLDPNVRGLIQPGADVELGDLVVQVEKE